MSAPGDGSATLSGAGSDLTAGHALTGDAVLGVAYATGSATLTDLGSLRPATVTIKTGATETAFDVPIFDDDIVEGAETFTVTVADGVATGTIAATAEPSVLIEPRRIGAGTARRRHVGWFDRMTGTVVRGGLRGSVMKTLTMSETLGSGAAAAGGRLGKTRRGSWIDGSCTGFDDTGCLRQFEE